MDKPLITRLSPAARALLDARQGDPFAYLGMHRQGKMLVVRAFLPDAQRVSVVEREGGGIAGDMPRLHDDGLFEGHLGDRPPFPYRLRIENFGGATAEIDDIYAFPPVLGDVDVYLLGEGNHRRAAEVMGAHACTHDGVDGISFAVWAPNAERVSVVGDFNNWDGRRWPMRLRQGTGIWEIFIPGLKPGHRYKYEIVGSATGLLPLKADPYAGAAERPPGTASRISAPAAHSWQDDAFIERRWQINDRTAPISIYEVHLGSWRRHLEDGRYLSYRELAEQLVPYAVDMGFTHLELLPITEYPFDGSWGYQPTGLFAPTSRFGDPDDFRAFVDECHKAGLGLWLDWVPGHFPTDAHGLARFDGSALYEHADPRQGFQPDWNTFVYNFGRREVANFLLASAYHWIAAFHADGIRVDAVASMLYLDYSRRTGEWVPNTFGGRENLEAIDFLKRFNELVFGFDKGATTAAEESTAWPMVSRPTYLGGLGFGYKWNMGWMHDTLRYMSKDPIYRRYQHHDMTFGLLYGFHENFILPLSHDEVVHGKGSLIGKMPGDRWQRFANLRAYYGFMWTHPGKKLLFMGCEFAQEREWSHDVSLDWHLLNDPMHHGVQLAVRDLNRLYREIPALHELDAEADGFQWIDANDADNSTLSFLRRGRDPHHFAVVVCNFTPVPRLEHRIGVPRPGRYAERFNSDAREYGGSGLGNAGEAQAEPHPAHGHEWSLNLVLPPLATIVLIYDLGS